MEVKSEFASLCENIDQVLIQFFDTLADLYNEQSNLEEKMASGFLNMSRARYNMGIKSVGIDQCNTANMTASYRVNIDDQSEFSLTSVRDDSGLESNLHGLDINSDHNVSETILRKRNVTKDNQDVESGESEKIEDISEIEMKNLSKCEKSDPLKWFGVLVSPALRQSQAEFKTSVDIVIKVCNLKMKLAALQKEFVSLLKQKSILRKNIEVKTS